MVSLVKGLDPIVRDDTLMMVLGSFPSKESRRKGQYYANKENDFWKIWGRAIGEPLLDSGWESRKEIFLRHKIGLWDVFALAEQEGSSDAGLKNMVPNDLRAFLRRYPNVGFVMVAGDIAYEGFRGLNLDIPCYKIQSTSPSNRRWYTAEDKVNQIKGILRKINLCV